MKILNKIKSTLKTIGPKNSNSDSLEALVDFLGLRGVKKKELSEATYFACLKVLSETVGKMPLKLLRHNENSGVTVCRNHNLYRVLNERPNRYMTSTTFWSTMEYNRNHYGNAYALIVTKDLKTTVKTSLWILPSNQVEIWYDDAKKLSDIKDIYYRYTCNAGSFIFRF